MTARDVIAGVLVEHGINRRRAEWITDALIRAGVTMPADVITAEQLDKLPFLTVIREVRQPGRDGVDYGGVYERRTSGWHCIAGTWRVPERNGPPVLPVRVLWRGSDC